MLKSTTNQNKNVYQFAQPIKFTISNKENVILLKNWTDANVINATILHTENVKTFAKADCSGLQEVINVVLPPFLILKTNVNIIKD